MDLLRVDPNTFLPDEIIEGYSSLIWTERYLSTGEFELHTPLIKPTRKLIPKGSLITHRDTGQVMMVETPNVQPTQDGQYELVLKGRSLDFFIENRALEGPYQKKYKMARNYTAAEAASVILWNALVNPTDNDVTRIGPWDRSPKDKVDNTAVTDSTTVDGTMKRRWLSGGQADVAVRDLLLQNKLGFQTIRPSSGPGKTVSVATNNTGIISYDHVDEYDRLRWDIYNGTNHSRNQSANPRVIFHYPSGHITDPSYLWSIAAYKTMALVVSSVGDKNVYRDRASDLPLSGLDRRVLWVDGGQPGDNEDHDDFRDDLPDKGETELDKSDMTEVFDGTISPVAPYKYGINGDYYLGDKVTVIADFDIDQTMRVSEYVRTEDIEGGDRGFPTLVTTFEDSIS